MSGSIRVWCSLLASGLILSQAAAQDVPGIATADLCPAPLGADGVAPVSAEDGAGGWISICDWRPPFLRDTRLGARPHSGPHGDPSQGYDHYDLPSRHYGLWYRPAAFAEETNAQCKPRIYNPRGYGWGHRLDCLQMDYHPYVVKQLPSVHGPSYYHRRPLEPCHCCLQGHGKRRGALTR